MAHNDGMGLKTRSAPFVAVVCGCALLFLFIRAPSTEGDMTSALLIGGSKIDVTIESGNMKLTQAELLHWVQSAAEAVATYYGRYPVPHVLIRIIPADGQGVRHGQTFGYDGGFIKIRVGGETPASELASDWMLTHEMVHLSFPSVAENHHWIEDGIAGYFDPIPRPHPSQITAPQTCPNPLPPTPKA